MKNLVLAFLLALLIVVTAISVRRMATGNINPTGQKQTLVATGGDPVPWPPPPPTN